MGSGTNWTQQELDYLENSWGQTSIPSIAKHLGRSVNAVKLKAGRIGLGRHIHSGVRITLLQFCDAIGKRNSYGWIKDRWVRLGLPVHYQKSVTKEESSPWDLSKDRCGTTTDNGKTTKSRHFSR